MLVAKPPQNYMDQFVQSTPSEEKKETSRLFKFSADATSYNFNNLGIDSAKVMSTEATTQRKE